MRKRVVIRWVVTGILGMGTALGGQYLAVTHAADGSWTFQSVESILVNGKDKLRGVGLSSPPPASWDSKAIGRQAETRFGDFNVVRVAPDGTLLGRSSGEWHVLLPEGVKLKDAEPAAQLWKDAVIEVRQDRKDKTGNAVRVAELYAVVPGQDAGAAAAALATEVSWHALPGVNGADAFRATIAFLPEAARKFPSGAPAETMRSFLAGGMSDRLRTWRDGDAEIVVLDDAAALAAAAQSAFPADAPLSSLRAEVQESRQWLDRKTAILRALNAGKQADPFLLAYRDFEPFDRSFPTLSQAKLQHLNASAAAHLETARALETRGDYADAIRHLLIARWRNPKLAGVDEMLEQTRLEAARLSAQSFAEARRGIDPRSAARVQLQRKLLLVEQYIGDGKLEDAAKALHDAEAMDADEPRLALLYAQLAIARGELGRALALLDNYTGTAPTAEDLAQGEKLRASVLYNIDKERAKTASQLTQAFQEQHFSAALGDAADGLKVDNESPDFLYQAGVDTCILRNCEQAAPLLRRYLEVTDSTQADRRQRMLALGLLREAEAPRQAGANPPPQKTMEPRALSWFSGTPLPRGAFYDPMSLAFQPKVARIDASEHLTVNYEWGGSQLRSVHNKFEEKKLASNIAKLAIAGAAASQGLGSTVGWKTPNRETNDFYFHYYDDLPQVLKVSRDNQVVRSRTIPISIPGIGGFGGLGLLSGLGGGLFGGLGGLKSMGALGGGMAGMPGMAGLPGGMAGISGMAAPSLGGLGGGIFSRLAGLTGMGGAGGFNSFGAARQFLPSQQYSIRSDPEGGTTSGYLTLWNNPRLDTRLAWKVTGKRAAIGFSGNRFFHPFVWEAIHLFELDYDDSGRVLHAWEVDDPTAPRLDFTWVGQRLSKVTGVANSKDGGVVYSRVLNYSGDTLISETISQPGGKSARIEYKYDKQGRLVEADCDADHTLDGRSRKVHFVLEGEK